MQRPLMLLIAGLLVIGGFAAWLLYQPGEENVFRDLAAELSAAKARQPAPEAFSVVQATLNDETLPAIHVKDPSRVKWDVTVPENAWFSFSLGVQPDSWNVPGDGVLFMVGVSSHPKGYEELLSTTLNPHANPSDRRWQPMTIDLSPYAGKQIELILNTRSSPPAPHGQAEQDNREGDLALWGAPRVVIR